MSKWVLIKLNTIHFYIKKIVTFPSDFQVRKKDHGWYISMNFPSAVQVWKLTPNTFLNNKL